MNNLLCYLRKIVWHLVILSVVLLLIQIPGLAQHGQLAEKALVMAAYKNNSTRVRLLIHRGIAVDARYQGKTALMAASLMGHRRIVYFLLNHGAKPNTQSIDEMTALMYSVDGKQEHINVVAELLKHGADPNIHSNFSQSTVLEYAIQSHYYKSVALLLCGGANPNLRQSDGSTPLINAAHSGNVEGVRILLPKVVNIDQSDQWDDTALNMSAREGYTAIVKLLIDSGANINRTTKFSRDTPLIVASSADLESVQLLVSHGANLNAQNKLGESPLIVASSCGKLSIVQFLLDKGADYNLKDSKNRSVLDCAKISNFNKKNKAQIISILEKAMEKKTTSFP